MTIKNIFKSHYSDFILTDIRTERKNKFAGYTVTEEQTFEKHQIMLPPDLIAGKTILDLGCCVGATGAWVLHNGAKSYTGVELQPDLAKAAKANLDKHFANFDCSVHQMDIEEFVNSAKTKYDIVVAFGVIYTVTYYQSFIKKLTTICDTVVVESSAPSLLLSAPLNKIPNAHLLPIVEYFNNGFINHASGASTRCEITMPSMTALEMDFARCGWVGDFSKNELLIKTLPGVFSPISRFCVVFNSDTVFDNRYFKDCYGETNKDADVSWASDANNNKELQEFFTIPGKIANLKNGGHRKWEFNSDVAEIFVDHARQHIQDYDKIIDMCVNIANKKFAKSDKIIDVGCATGHTLIKLLENGFTNIVGVESSESMIAKCPAGISQLIRSDSFPKDKYDMVICNWTLHFIKTKIQYLTDIFNGLEDGGMLILTDKTKNDGVELELYHDFKRGAGVSEELIAAKAASLHNVMFVNDPMWYLTTLRDIGFRDISILNATPCFTSFLAYK